MDLILRDIKRVEKIIEDTERGIITANYQTGHPHGYISTMYRGELAVSRILYARDEDFRELKKRAEAYPSVLRDSLTQFFMFEAGFSLMLARANAGSGDRYYVAGHIFRAVSCLNQVLFALNDTYCINEKKAVRMTETFGRRPDRYAQKVDRIFAALGYSLHECCDLAERLHDEVKQLV